MSPKSFAILAGATAISLALAGIAIAWREQPIHSVAAGEPLFPGLLDQLNDIRQIQVTTPTGKLTLTAKDKGWILAEKGGYPVEPAQVRELALAVANLQALEAKTADPTRLKRLELEEPGGEGAKSRLVALSGQDGKPLAAVVVGKARPELYGSGGGGVYARRAGKQQAWLASGKLDVPADAMALLDHAVINLPADHIARVTLQPTGAAAITLQRPDAKATEFTAATPLPEGAKLDPGKVELVVGSLAGLTMTDVRPAADLAMPADARHSRFETFDGLGVDVTVTRQGEGDASESWLKLAVAPLDQTAAAPAAAAADTPIARAAALGAKVDDWAFKVPPYIADRLAGGLDQVVAEPKPAS